VSREVREANGRSVDLLGRHLTVTMTWANQLFRFAFFARPSSGIEWLLSPGFPKRAKYSQRRVFAACQIRLGVYKGTRF
jgi:hypothetical protein